MYCHVIFHPNLTENLSIYPNSESSGSRPKPVTQLRQPIEVKPELKKKLLIPKRSRWLFWAFIMLMGPLGHPFPFRRVLFMGCEPFRLLFLYNMISMLVECSLLRIVILLKLCRP